MTLESTKKAIEVAFEDEDFFRGVVQDENKFTIQVDETIDGDTMTALELTATEMAMISLTIFNETIEVGVAKVA